MQESKEEKLTGLSKNCFYPQSSSLVDLEDKGRGYQERPTMMSTS